MDRSVAAALLGIAESADSADVRAAYRRRSRVVHPDRMHSASAAERQAAAELMAQLNDAQRVLLAHRPAPTQTPSPTPTPRAEPHTRSTRAEDTNPEPQRPTSSAHNTKPAGTAQPTAPRCERCLRRPGKLLTFRWAIGLAVWFTWNRQQATLCRDCAEMAYHDAQAKNFTFGWLGVVAPLAMIAAGLGNGANYTNSADLPVPQPSLHNRPSIRPWFYRPWPAISCVAWLTALFAVAWTAAADPVGADYDCWRYLDSTTLERVACGDPAATFRTTSEVSDDSWCSSTTDVAIESSSTGRTYCLQELTD